MIGGVCHGGYNVGAGKGCHGKGIGGVCHGGAIDVRAGNGCHGKVIGGIWHMGPYVGASKRLLREGD